eukprot:Gregarina_sp_Pseudo_9__2625@NODE_2884_length_837_cov_6_604010_g2637_i0_p1_GENE_NODE_2884_length_837_cov_6_604010_g2637_i0NODE_2884_length_837_cov_6_604010_g2637_i0_p1_ORF_typecomplete_len256_score37_97_NODE_2884_length_837_cov_6_604010_g2637_i070837
MGGERRLLLSRNFLNALNIMDFNLIFQTRYRPARGRDIRVFALGTIPELGTCRINDNKLKQKLQQSIWREYRHELRKELRRRREGWPHSTDGSRDGDDPASDDDNDADEEENLNYELDCFLTTANSTLKVCDRLDPKQILVQVVEGFAVPLMEDPDDTGVEDLWGSEPIKIVSLQPGDAFSYAYFAYDFDRCTVWDIEQFHEARKLEIPRNIGQPGVESVWVCRSVALHRLKATLEPETYYYPLPSDDDHSEEED